MNQINPKKLLNSKWTAVNPVKKELHFMVTDLLLNEDNEVGECTLEAIMTRRSKVINWQDLKNSAHWLQGWK
ncbi:tryptophan-rich hypothetical protein [Marinicella litoralis]|uniref:TIGR02450 family Trp-rich protein n=2 Tax=Marinicella litoralis TaxID=644220 RepID=A0A4R6XLE4_9GAMM|nr:tryptophan-rich hypothetical protein [Marinicella litoralis]